MKRKKKRKKIGMKEPVIVQEVTQAEQATSKAKSDGENGSSRKAEPTIMLDDSHPSQC